MRDVARSRPAGVEDQSRRGQIVAILAVAILVTFLLLAGVDLGNAQQTFDITLGETIETVQAGSAVRQVALVGFAVIAGAVLIAAGPRPATVKPIIVVPLVLLLVLMAVSVTWAIDPQLTLRRVIAYGAMLVGAFVCARVLSVRTIVLGTLAFTGLFVVLAVVAQIVAGPFTPALGGWRLAGIVHPVALSWYCGLGAIAAVTTMRLEPSLRLPATWAAAAFAGCLVLTKTRTGLGATLLAILVVWFLTAPRGSRRDLPVVVAWIALITFLVALAFPGDHFSWNSLYAGTVESSSLGRTDAVEQIATFTGRLPVWEASLALVSQRPMLGFGFSAFQSPEMIPVLAEAAGWVPTSTHSGYIDALLSLGFVGLGLVAWVVGGSTIESIRMARMKPHYTFSVAVLTWLIVNLAFEAPVLFDPLFSSFLVFVLVGKVALFPDVGPAPERS